MPDQTARTTEPPTHLPAHKGQEKRDREQAPREERRRQKGEDDRLQPPHDNR
ncbi:hypothetical protein [Caenibius sp. WL]|uniref:hypothetical protein n=1 Tax=Caenibius sp. WL TaxID=2872646 RepID=UPI001C9A0A28|nr:hypothetical protein [Caenibius sp. WL]QZP08164.1 hypothetical protein K5X80_16275 [Caenibius sp. WL]